MASLSDIAKALNLDASTVSRAMTKPHKVAPETRKKILDYIDQIGFRPNLTARNLRKKCTYTIGIVVNDLCDSVIAKAASIMQEEAAKRGFFPIVLSTGDSRAKEREILEQLFNSNVSGLVIIPSSATAELLSTLPKIPIVELDRSTGSKLFDEYRMDDVAAMQLATDYLQQQRCINVAVVLGNVQRISSFANRLAALGQCSKAMNYYPYAVTAVKASDLTSQACALTQSLLQPQNTLQSSDLLLSPGELKSQLESLGIKVRATAFKSKTVAKSTTKRASKQALKLVSLEQMKNYGLKFDAILATNNSLASGVLQACYALSIEPQRELQIFTFDNPDWLQVLPFKLPTITHPMEKAAYLAINRVLDRVEKKYTGDIEERLIRPELMT